MSMDLSLTLRLSPENVSLAQVNLQVSILATLTCIQRQLNMLLYFQNPEGYGDPENVSESYERVTKSIENLLQSTILANFR